MLCIQVTIVGLGRQEGSAPGHVEDGHRLLVEGKALQQLAGSRPARLAQPRGVRALEVRSQEIQMLAGGNLIRRYASPPPSSSRNPQNSVNP